jgi:hypothetical protein
LNSLLVTRSWDKATSGWLNRLSYKAIRPLWQTTAHGFPFQFNLWFLEVYETAINQSCLHFLISGTCLLLKGQQSRGKDEGSHGRGGLNDQSEEAAKALRDLQLQQSHTDGPENGPVSHYFPFPTPSFMPFLFFPLAGAQQVELLEVTENSRLLFICILCLCSV